MSKAVLVMDMPQHCYSCPLLVEEVGGSWCAFNGEPIEEELDKLESCPLKPMPQKQKLTFVEQGQDAITMGWNACIEEIEGNLK